MTILMNPTRQAELVGMVPRGMKISKSSAEMKVMVQPKAMKMRVVMMMVSEMEWKAR